MMIVADCVVFAQLAYFVPVHTERESLPCLRTPYVTNVPKSCYTATQRWLMCFRPGEGVPRVHCR
jgi:hypothetical protein